VLFWGRLGELEFWSSSSIQDSKSSVRIRGRGFGDLGRGEGGESMALIWGRLEYRRRRRRFPAGGSGGGDEGLVKEMRGGRGAVWTLIYQDEVSSGPSDQLTSTVEIKG